MFKFLIAILSTQQLFAHGMSEEAKKALIDGGLLEYVWVGAEHMITGYDHVLFLLGVVFFLSSFKDIVKFVTAFTLGHSITLIAATLMKVTANFWIVDAVIALSVIYKGFDNNKVFENYFGMKKAPNILGMVFFFGLIHGFGLSTRLQQLPLGNDTIQRILAFNVGVEIGQIIVLAIIVGLLGMIRKKDFFARFSKIANDGLILAGFVLFLHQIHGFSHTSSPGHYGFSEEGHYQHHVKLFEEERARRQQRHNHGHHGHDHGHDHHNHDH